MTALSSNPAIEKGASDRQKPALEFAPRGTSDGTNAQFQEGGGVISPSATAPLRAARRLRSPPVGTGTRRTPTAAADTGQDESMTSLLNPASILPTLNVTEPRRARKESGHPTAPWASRGCPSDAPSLGVARHVSDLGGVDEHSQNPRSASSGRHLSVAPTKRCRPAPSDRCALAVRGLAPVVAAEPPRADAAIQQ